MRTSHNTWYDYVYYGQSVQTVNTAKYAGRIRQIRLLDPIDGYTSSFSINLEKDDIGSFHVFVKVDAYRSVSIIPDIILNLSLYNLYF